MIVDLELLDSIEVVSQVKLRWPRAFAVGVLALLSHDPLSLDTVCITCPEHGSQRLSRWLAPTRDRR